LSDGAEIMFEPLSQSDIASATANEAVRDIKQINASLSVIIGVLKAVGWIKSCPVCAGKGETWNRHDGHRKCNDCNGAGITAVTPYDVA
jgi:hypothetical protein